jgi:hypothetical protein
MCFGNNLYYKYTQAEILEFHSTHPSPSQTSLAQLIITQGTLREPWRLLATHPFF